MTKLEIHVTFANGEHHVFPLEENGDWHTRDYSVPLLIIRPTGGARANDGVWQPRYEIPLINVLFYKLVKP